MSRDNFGEWIKVKCGFFLFFDGASKGNLGTVRGGGIILDLNKQVSTRFAWGLGFTYNNQVEYWAL